MSASEVVPALIEALAAFACGDYERCNTRTGRAKGWPRNCAAAQREVFEDTLL